MGGGDLRKIQIFGEPVKDEYGTAFPMHNVSSRVPL